MIGGGLSFIIANETLELAVMLVEGNPLLTLNEFEFHVIKTYFFNQGDELYVNDPAGLSSNPRISFHICQKIIAYAFQ